MWKNHSEVLRSRSFAPFLFSRPKTGGYFAFIPRTALIWQWTTRHKKSEARLHAPRCVACGCCGLVHAIHAAARHRGRRRVLLRNIRHHGLLPVSEAIAIVIISIDPDARPGRFLQILRDRVPGKGVVGARAFGSGAIGGHVHLENHDGGFVGKKAGRKVVAVFFGFVGFGGGGCGIILLLTFSLFRFLKWHPPLVDSRSFVDASLFQEFDTWDP